MKLNKCDNYVVCIVGDGSFTNGMIYEALNNCDNKNLKLIIILNDNEMSISSNVGSLAKHLSKVRTSTKYYKLKRYVKINVLYDNMLEITLTVIFIVSSMKLQGGYAFLVYLVAYLIYLFIEALSSVSPRIATISD